MKRLYEKSELSFAILWIIIYVVLMSVADNLSIIIGVEKVITAPISIALLAVLLAFIFKQNLVAKYGLIKGCFPKKTYLFFIPLIVTVSVNFWGGVKLQYSILESAFFVASMLSVGFLEEVIFRGFLFKALSKDNLTVAVIVSSVTFGLGHIVNLLSGANFLSTLLQIVYATAAGFLFTIIFYKSGSLLPCIITHSVMNATSVFACNVGVTMEVITAVVLIVVSVFYAIWIIKTSPKTTENGK